MTGCQGNLKLYYFLIRLRPFLFGFLQNQPEIAKSYLRKFILNCLKIQQAVLPANMSNFNQKNIKIT